jgi:hypothetical protein
VRGGSGRGHGGGRGGEGSEGKRTRAGGSAAGWLSSNRGAVAGRKLGLSFWARRPSPGGRCGPLGFAGVETAGRSSSCVVSPSHPPRAALAFAPRGARELVRPLAPPRSADPRTAPGVAPSPGPGFPPTRRGKKRGKAGSRDSGFVAGRKLGFFSLGPAPKPRWAVRSAWICGGLDGGALTLVRRLPRTPPRAALAFAPRGARGLVRRLAPPRSADPRTAPGVAPSPGPGFPPTREERKKERGWDRGGRARGSPCWARCVAHGAELRQPFAAFAASTARRIASGVAGRRSSTS